MLHRREREREFIRGSKRVKGPWCLIHEGGEVVEEEEDEEEDEEKLIQYSGPNMPAATPVFFGFNPLTTPCDSFTHQR